MYLCKSCGNKILFYERGLQEKIVRETVYCTRYLDENGNVDDDEEGDYHDSETQEYGNFTDGEGVKCKECDCEAYDVDDDEWEAWVEGKSENEQPNGDPECRKLNDLKASIMTIPKMKVLGVSKR